MFLLVTPTAREPAAAEQDLPRQPSALPYGSVPVMLVSGPDAGPGT